MARTGQSSQDRLGIMVWTDLIYTSCIFPLKYFFIGAWTLLYKTAPKQELSQEEKHAVQNHKWMILISIIIALVLTIFVASQLSQVLPAFGQLWRQFFQTLTSLLDFTLTFKDNGLLFSRLITSIPLALGLFAQLAATYLAKEKPSVKNDLKAILKRPVSSQK